jgi:hypothetical protein
VAIFVLLDSAAWIKTLRGGIIGQQVAPVGIGTRAGCAAYLLHVHSARAFSGARPCRCRDSTKSADVGRIGMLSRFRTSELRQFPATSGLDSGQTGIGQACERLHDFLRAEAKARAPDPPEQLVSR